MEGRRKRQDDAARDAVPSHYILACPLCGGRFPEPPRGFLLACPERHPPALLRAVYREKRLVVHHEASGVFRYADWLPTRRLLRGGAGSVVYHSEGLGPSLGLDGLFIVWNGWWPEKGGEMETCTFKELEAQAVCGRIAEGEESAIVVSSAGNTARAFHDACARHGVPALIVVPEQCLPSLWSAVAERPFVRLAALGGGADYADAIEAGNRLAAADGYYPEGGARNAARRDGMGTAVLAAVEAVGAIPDHYFQAVGSGTGAIAAWEMNLRLIEDGRFGGNRMRLHLSQNAPFTPMTDAWESRSRILEPGPDARERSMAIHAPVLSNRNPPYAVAGGVYDALADTGGEMYRVTGEEARDAGGMFERLEGCDIDPAAEVCVASLRQAVALGRIGARDIVALNITGGGERRLRGERRTHAVSPQAIFTMDDMRRDDAAGALAPPEGARS